MRYDIMKILTIGAGVIGVTYSWQLQKAGFNITHLVRHHKIELYRENGIIIRCSDFRSSQVEYCMELYRPNFVDQFSAKDGYQYVLVSVNSNQLLDLLPVLKENAGSATIIFLQNMKIGDDEILDQYLDRTQYVICYPFKAGGGRAENTVETVIFGLRLVQTVIGEKDGTITDRIKRIYAMFKKADMNPKLIAKIVPYLRTHYIWAACSAAAYMEAGTYDRFIMHDSIKDSYRAMREGWKICRKQGIYPWTVAPTCYYYLPFFILIPLTQWLYKKQEMKEMFERHIKHSTIEMKDMYYTLLDEARKYDIKMPVYEGYETSVQEYIGKINEHISPESR
jgi:2-dehydropantoate 2-reductase